MSALHASMRDLSHESQTCLCSALTPAQRKGPEGAECVRSWQTGNKRDACRTIRETCLMHLRLEILILVEFWLTHRGRYSVLTIVTTPLATFKREIGYDGRRSGGLTVGSRSKKSMLMNNRERCMRATDVVHKSKGEGDDLVDMFVSLWDFFETLK